LPHALKSRARAHQHNNVSYRQHIAIVDAIRRRDPDEADRALQTHLNSVSATWHAFGQKKQSRKK
jgi:DNA-binding FadR family transcriptional regulator